MFNKNIIFFYMLISIYIFPHEITFTNDENTQYYIEHKETINDENIETDINLITEEQLQKIIDEAKHSPTPTENIDLKNLDTIVTEENDFNTNIELISDLKDTFEKYNFSTKSTEVHVGRINANEFTSDQLLHNGELGIGIAYQEQNNKKIKNWDEWNYTPIYATGKYKISESNESTKYLKINLGYSFKELSKDEREYHDDKIQGGMYYGIGGGIDFRDMSVGVMYQVNKNGIEERNARKDDSRVTVSVDYKLEI